MLKPVLLLVHRGDGGGRNSPGLGSQSFKGPMGPRLPNPDEEDKINALEALYDEGREIGVAKFKADPRYQKYISSEDELEAVKEQKDKIRGNKESLIESVKQTRKWQGNQKK